METIVPYMLTPKVMNRLEAPLGARALSVTLNGPRFCLWVACDTDRARNDVVWALMIRQEDDVGRIVGSQFEHIKSMTFLNTVIDGPNTWHCFTIEEADAKN